MDPGGPTWDDTFLNHSGNSRNIACRHCLQTLPADTLPADQGGWKIDAAEGPGQGPGAASVGWGIVLTAEKVLKHYPMRSHCDDL